jgi:radical SAM protein with 4Fe4S-binding SPASM domain
MLHELSTAEWLSVIDQLWDLGFEVFYFLGGEPLLRPDLPHLLKYAKRLGAYNALSTNGILAERVAPRLAGLIDEVQVSLDGSSPDINDPIRGPGSFKHAVNAVKVFKALGVRVTLSYTVTKLNLNDDFERYVKLAEELGVDAVNFAPAVNFGRAAKNKLAPGVEESRGVLERLLSIKSSVAITFSGFRFALPDLIKAAEEARRIANSLYRSCPAGVYRLVVFPNGDVYGCELLTAYRAGNVRRRRVRDMWEEGLKPLRSMTIPKLCSYCPIVDICQGGCPARRYAELGRLDAPDPLCTLAVNRSFDKYLYTPKR